MKVSVHHKKRKGSVPLFRLMDCWQKQKQPWSKKKTKDLLKYGVTSFLSQKNTPTHWWIRTRKQSDGALRALTTDGINFRSSVGYRRARIDQPLLRNSESLCPSGSPRDHVLFLKELKNKYIHLSKSQNLFLLLFRLPHENLFVGVASFRIGINLLLHNRVI